MRFLLFTLALLAGAAFSVSAADAPALITNSVTVGKKGVLQIPAPKDWTFAQTNASGAQPYASLHSPDNSIAIELSVFWDGINKENSKPTEADFSQIVSNVSARGYEQNSVEKTINLEKLQGPAVSGVFARFTDSRWVPMLKGDYPHITTGMFRSGNLWGNFTLLTYDKDGPLFRQGLKILESMRRQP